MSHLQATAIANLATVRSGAGAPQDPSAFSHDGHPFIRAGSLSRLLDGDDENQLEKIRPDVARAHRLQLFPKGTVLFAKSGMSATKGYIYSLKQPAYIVSHLAALVPHDSRDSPFLARALQHFPPTSLIKDQAYPSIRLGDIERMEILAPASIDDRGRIAAILDKADVQRCKRKRTLNLLNSLTQSIFEEMFGELSRHKVVTVAKSLLRPLRNGLSPAKAGVFPGKVLTLSAITSGAFKPSATKEAMFANEPPAKQCVEQGEFLICRGNGNKSLVGVGVFASRSMPDTLFPDTIIAGRIDPDKFHPQFFEDVWNGKFVRSQIEKTARTTNGTFKVNQSGLESISIPMPDICLQEAYGEKVALIQRTRIVASNQLNFSNILFSSLESRAFSGEL